MSISPSVGTPRAAARTIMSRACRRSLSTMPTLMVTWRRIRVIVYSGNTPEIGQHSIELVASYKGKRRCSDSSALPLCLYEQHVFATCPSDISRWLHTPETKASLRGLKEALAGCMRVGYGIEPRGTVSATKMNGRITRPAPCASAAHGSPPNSVVRRPVSATPFYHATS
jgi:hypothetical protein